MLSVTNRAVQVLDTLAILAYGIGLLRGWTPPLWATSGLILLIAASAGLQLLVWRREPNPSPGDQRWR